MTKPHFLGIGAQKAGTSWLRANLRAHPGIWMPPVKELHYFRFPQGRNTLRLWLRHHPHHIAIDKIGKQLRSIFWPVEAGRIGQPRWHVRFLLLRRSDQWYQSLFRSSRGRISGEITPAYARLSPQQVEHVALLLPNAKLIFIMRDPIERAWSQAAMHFSKAHHTTLQNIDATELLAYLSKAAVAERSDYLTTLDRWSRRFPREQLFIGYFEEIRDSPESLLARLCNFLGLSYAPDYFPNYHIRVNRRPYPVMPRTIEQFLAERYLPMLDQLYPRYDNQFTAAWLERAGKLLSRSA